MQSPVGVWYNRLQQELGSKTESSQLGREEQDETPRVQQGGMVGSDRADNVPDLMGGRGLSELSDSESTGGRQEQDSTVQVAKIKNDCDKEGPLKLQQLTPCFTLKQLM